MPRTIWPINHPRRIDTIIHYADKAGAVIRRKHKNTGKTKGMMVCPLCGEDLYWLIRFNGHIHAHCITKNCLEWME